LLGMGDGRVNDHPTTWERCGNHVPLRGGADGVGQRAGDLIEEAGRSEAPFLPSGGEQ
jgi:hypothetical protein